MKTEIKIGDRIVSVELISEEGTAYVIKVDDNEYTLDVVKVEEGVYSVIHNSKSINMSIIEGDTLNRYNVMTRSNYYDVEVLDAFSRYRDSSEGEAVGILDDTITTPMPGKVVKLYVKEGDSIKEGEVAITISSMKMESDYKFSKSGVVKKVYVSEGDSIAGNQPLVEVEAAN